MATYCVTFRIANKVVDGKDYDTRRKLLLNNACEGSDGWWAEPTSFIIVSSPKDTYEFAKQVTKVLSAKIDLILIFDPSDMSAVCFGNVEHPSILSEFIPSVRFD